jgi:hypothetical protein
MRMASEDEGTAPPADEAPATTGSTADAPAEEVRRRFRSLPPLAAGAVLGWLTALVFTPWGAPLWIDAVALWLFLRTTLGALIGAFLTWILAGIITRLRPSTPEEEGLPAPGHPQAHTPGTHGEYLPFPPGDPFGGSSRIRPHSVPDEEDPEDQAQDEG